LITAVTEPGEVVWEPFGGLCSASVAAVALDRRAFAAETDPGFADLAEERLRSSGDAGVSFGAGVAARRSLLGGRSPPPAHLARVAWQPPGLGERPAEHELDLRVRAAQLVGGPPGGGVVHGRIQAQQDALAFRHW